MFFFNVHILLTLSFILLFADWTFKCTFFGLCLLMTKSLILSLPLGFFSFVLNSASVSLPLSCLLAFAYSLIIPLLLFMLVTPANKEVRVFLPVGLPGLGLGLAGLFGLGVGSWGVEVWAVSQAVQVWDAEFCHFQGGLSSPYQRK